MRKGRVRKAWWFMGKWQRKDGFELQFGPKGYDPDFNR